MNTRDELEILSKNIDNVCEGVVDVSLNIIESSFNETFNPILLEGVKSKLKKAWEKIVKFFQAVINKFNDIFRGTSEKLNMAVSPVDGGTHVEIKAGTKVVFKRTIDKNEKVMLLNVDTVGKALEKIGKELDSTAFGEDVVTESVFDDPFFTECAESFEESGSYDSQSGAFIPGNGGKTQRVEQKKVSKKETDPEGDKKLEQEIWVLLNNSRKATKGSETKAFTSAANALNTYSGKLLSATRKISNKVIKRAKNAPDPSALRKYRLLKDVVNVIASFRSYITDID